MVGLSHQNYRFFQVYLSGHASGHASVKVVPVSHLPV